MRGTGCHKAPEISVNKVRVEWREEIKNSAELNIHLKQFVENGPFHGICEYAPADASRSGHESDKDIYKNRSSLNFYNKGPI